MPAEDEDNRPRFSELRAPSQMPPPLTARELTDDDLLVSVQKLVEENRQLKRQIKEMEERHGVFLTELHQAMFG